MSEFDRQLREEDADIIDAMREREMQLIMDANKDHEQEFIKVIEEQNTIPIEEVPW